MMFGLTARQRSAEPSLPPLLFDTVGGNTSHYALITSKANIARRLQDLARSHQQMRLHLFHEHEVAGVYQSSIQHIDTADEVVILHQLMPNSWRKLIGTDDPVSISCYTSNGHVVFDTVISPLEAGEDNPFCVIRYPEAMHVQQLRTAFRVAMLPNSGRVEMWVGRDLLRGKCLDLSLNGCCAQFPLSIEDALAATVAPGQGWVIHFLYDGREMFEARAVISRMKQDSPGLMTVGLSFQNQDPLRTRSLQPLLLALQRERIRLHPDSLN